MMNQVTAVETTESRWHWLYRISGAAALIIGMVLLVGMIRLIAAVLQPITPNSWLSPLQDNWLIVIFKLHAGFGGIQIEMLQILNFLDLAILVLVATMYLGLYVALQRTSKIWSIIAAIQPFLGIVLFITTQSAGRSTVMGAGLVISFVMLRSDVFNKATAYIGILASVLVLVGDLSAGVVPPLTIVATLFGIGYGLLMAWFFSIARRLFQLGEAS